MRAGDGAVMSDAVEVDGEHTAVFFGPGEQPLIAIEYYPEAGVWGWHLVQHPDLGAVPFESKEEAMADASAVFARFGWRCASWGSAQ